MIEFEGQEIPNFLENTYVDDCDLNIDEILNTVSLKICFYLVVGLTFFPNSEKVAQLLAKDYFGISETRLLT